MTAVLTGLISLGQPFSSLWPRLPQVLFGQLVKALVGTVKFEIAGRIHPATEIDRAEGACPGVDATIVSDVHVTGYDEVEWSSCVSLPRIAVYLCKRVGGFYCLGTGCVTAALGAGPIANAGDE